MPDASSVYGRRVAAFFIDGVLSAVIGLVMFVALADKVDGVDCAAERAINSVSFCVQSGSSGYVLTNGDTAPLFLVYLIWWVVNQVVLEAKAGTVGKRIVGLRTVRRDNGAPVGIGKALGRNLLLFVDSLCCALVGLISSLTDDDRRRLGDRAAGTLVVSKGAAAAMMERGAAAAQLGGVWTPSGPGTGGGAASGSVAGQIYGSGGAGASPWGASGAASGSSPAWPPQGSPPQAQWPQQQQGSAPLAPPPPVGAPPSAPKPGDPGFDAPHWDPAIGAYRQWDPKGGRWLRWDQQANLWVPMS